MWLWLALGKMYLMEIKYLNEDLVALLYAKSCYSQI